MLSIFCIICLKSVAPPKISEHHIFTAFICLLGIPFWVCDIVSSSLDCLTIHLPLLFTNQAQSHISCPHKRYNRHQCRCRHHYNNYHKRSRSKEDTRKGKQAHSTFDGWALWPHPASHINQPLPVSQSLLNDFISTHNPSWIMEVTDLFSIQVDDTHGIVLFPSLRKPWSQLLKTQNVSLVLR